MLLRSVSKSVILVAGAVAIALVLGFAPNSTAQKPADTEYTAWTPSQKVDCKLVDQRIAMIPHGDGDPVTAEETGPGGWRFSGRGTSFVTFGHWINDNGTPEDLSDDYYEVDAGRSNWAANAGIFNDYPRFLDLPQKPIEEGALMFHGRRGRVVVTGDGENFDFTLPGAGAGRIIINVTDPDGDGVYEGCAKTPLLKNFGFVVPEGGDFVQKEYFKAYAETDANGVVTFYEWTEISTFKNTDPNAY